MPFETLLRDRTCRICRSSTDGPSEQLSDDVVIVRCSRCGPYEIGPPAYLALQTESAGEKRYLLSALAKTAPLLWGSNRRIELADVEAMRAGALREKPFSEKLLLAMRWLERKQTNGVGVLAETNPELDYPAAYCRDAREWQYVLGQLSGLGYITTHGDPRIASAQISASGWLWLEERTKGGDGCQAFIAMSFGESMRTAEAAIKRGVEAAGYEAVLVKYREFTDGIVDQILAEIRRSRFMIADFTENKAGVYYEAGFGLGLGLKVIGTCRADELNSLHFDVKHLNMISWNSERLVEFSDRIAQRIRAVVGPGPVAQQHESE